MNHVLHEIQMYQHSFFCLVTNRLIEYNKMFGVNEGNVLKNALYESHALHTRNLFGFFRDHKSRDDDLIYIDIIDKEIPYFQFENEYKKYKDIINKCFAHMTRRRNEDDYIKKNNMSMFIYLCYSNNNEFIGLGRVIKAFLDCIEKKSLVYSLPDGIGEELIEKEISDLFSWVRTDNDTLLRIEMKIKKCFENNLRQGGYCS